MNCTSTYEAAQDYFARFWSIVPLASDPKAPKLPVCKWGELVNYRLSPNMHKLYFLKRQCSIGLIFDVISGRLTSVDFDEAGSYDRWAVRQPALARSLPTVKTRRGHHVYFETMHRTVREIRKQIGKPHGRGAIATGFGEFRTGKCYSAAPPTVHKDGRYEWIVPLPPAANPLPLIDPRDADLVDVDTILRAETESEQRLSVAYKSGTQEVGCGARDETRFQAETHPPIITLDPTTTGPKAIAATLPIGPGQRRRRLFDLARVLRGRMPDATSKQLREIVAKWHRAALPVIRTKDFAATWSDFSAAWQLVEQPVREFTLYDALASANVKPFPEAAEQFKKLEQQVLVSLCREMQLLSYDDFFLSCRTIGEILGIPCRTASRWLGKLVDAKVLEITKKYPRNSRRATEYRYIGD